MRTLAIIVLFVLTMVVVSFWATIIGTAVSIFSTGITLGGL